MKKGFTLAEVLITLGIIGVVAGLTMPVFTRNYQKQVFTDALKKNYALISQSIDLCGCNNLNPGWLGTINGRSSTNYSTAKQVQDIERCIIGHLKYTENYGYIIPTRPQYSFPIYHNRMGNQIAPTTGTGTPFYSLKLANGSFLFLHFTNYSDGNISSLNVMIDVNGKRGPNILGRDLFTFLADKNGNLYIPGSQKSRDYVLKNCNDNPAGGYGIYSTVCSALIQIDGWRMSEDYPW